MSKNNKKTKSKIKNSKTSHNIPQFDANIIEQELENQVRKARDIITSYEPLALLKYGYEHFVTAAFGKLSESEWSMDENMTRRMIDYVQSVIVSSELQKDLKEIVDENEYKELFELIKKIYLNVTLFHSIAQTRKNQKREDYDFKFDEFKTMSVMEWVNVCGKRYAVFEFIHLEAILTPHKEIIKEILEIEIVDLIQALKDIKNSVEQGYLQQWKLLKQSHEKFIEIADEIKDVTDIEGVRAELQKHLDFDIDEPMTKIQSCDFFDINNVCKLPTKLLDLLSYEPNQNKFFFEGKHKGLPLKKIPIKEKPFLKYKNKYYCFETSHLFDNIYRNIEAIILEKRPSYLDSWNKRQGKIAQNITFDLFKKIIPTASFYGTNHYLYEGAWHENDGIIVFDDNVLILEIKAGKFKTKSPFTDFNSYIDSIQRLLESPVKQANRIISILDKDSEVSLFEKEDIKSNVKIKLNKKDIKNIFICSISLENFNTFANNTPLLKTVGFKIPDKPVWSLSIDDLRVYSDLFDNDITFIHFLKERMLASQSNIVDLNDELDHLGLYFSYNKYVQHIQELKKEHKADKLSFGGYIDKIDEYYALINHVPEEAIKPEQNIPEFLKHILYTINNKKDKYFTEVVCNLLDFSGDGRNQLMQMINQVLKEQFISRRSKHLEVYGMSVFCVQDNIPFLSQKEIEDIVYASMVIQNRTERLVLILSFDKDNKIYDSKITKFTLELNEENIKKYKSQVETLKARRFQKVLSQNKLGRNDRCPCGSGKKYKNCCLK